MNRPNSKSRLPFEHPTFLAPMEGVTHPLYREIIASHGGLGCLCTEFVRITDTRLRPEQLAREVVRTPGIPLSVQVMGRNLERMRDAAIVLEEAGADVIDINMGCPTKRAAKGGVGAAMLKDPVLLYDVVATLREAVSCRVSAKIRAGFDDRSRVVELARVVEEAGADYIAVHPRSRKDSYTGVADWRIIRTLRQEITIPVVGNGDCWYAKDVLRMIAETGCDGVMIGRPAMRNPWIFAQAAALFQGKAPMKPSGDEVVRFLAHVGERYGAAFGKHAVGPMKELLRWMARAVDEDRTFAKAVLREQSADAMVSRASKELAGVSAERLDLDVAGSLAFERSGSALEDRSASLVA